MSLGFSLSDRGFMAAIDMGGGPISPCSDRKRRRKGGTPSALLEMFTVYTTRRGSIPVVHGPVSFGVLLL